MPIIPIVRNVLQAFRLKTVRDRLCVNAKLIGTHGRAVEWAHPRSTRTIYRGVTNRRPQIEQILLGRRAA